MEDGGKISPQQTDDCDNGKVMLPNGPSKEVHACLSILSSDGISKMPSGEVLVQAVNRCLLQKYLSWTPVQMTLSFLKFSIYVSLNPSLPLWRDCTSLSLCLVRLRDPLHSCSPWFEISRTMCFGGLWTSHTDEEETIIIGAHTPGSGVSASGRHSTS